MSKNIMILGTASSVGKSTISTALCRYLKKKKYKVAPFKALNISLNSGVTKLGEEIGRAQIVQAEACEIDAKGIMNPVLIKPSVNNKTQIIVNGKVYCNMENCDYNEVNNDLKEFIKEDLEKLSKEYEVLVLEGSGSCVEINLKDTDIANLSVAKEAKADVILVGDIDRGGVFASIYGTIMLLDEEERALVKGVIINKFRGDKESFKEGIKKLEELIDVPVLGVLPYEELNIEDEDIVTNRLRNTKKSGLNIGIIKLPHMSNFTDFYPLELEKNVNIRYVKTPKELEGANLIILPGSKNTIYDLEVIKENGLYDKIIEMSREGATVLGICAGFQMLGESITDSLEIEGERKSIDGFKMLPLKTTYSREKKTIISKGVVCSLENELKELANIKVYGYEIHNGISEIIGDSNPLTIDKNNNITGLCNDKGDILGTYIHGIFEGADFRHNFINTLKKKYNVVIENRIEEKENYKKYKLNQYDKLCDLFEENIDTEKILELLEKEDNKIKSEKE